MRGLYVHVPFCLRKCHYCNYTITAAPTADDHENFFRAIETETRRARESYGALQFSTLYLGGGTPSSLDATEMERLFRILLGAFSLEKNAEVTCEVNPGEADRAKLEAYRRLGVNRLSVGAQSFNDVLLADMGRIHDARATAEISAAARETGFENLSLDLIIRLPGQTLADVEDSLERAVAAGARQVVIYDLNVHDETVYGARARRGDLALPPDSLHRRMHDAVAEILVTKHRFRQYEISSFARPGFESRHNLIYWKNREYLGLGPGAFSYMEGKRYQYAKTVQGWLERIRGGDASNEEEHALRPEEIEIETLLTGLRLEDGVRLGDFDLIREHAAREVSALEEAGLVERAGDRIRLTREGKALAETVFTRLSLAGGRPVFDKSGVI